ncbi:choice-of-anchor Q domain-containing protein [Marinicella meishanensis]|uniref:choice-of-anchor Q domain-containing protein n=1 Tax=Marinicella meishanensis TaxID=2873263 RepID=UPI001CC15BB2|nr:choice-of-anchor Q domain-containing protein [Marinicella sp. NBU2979]
MKRVNQCGVIACCLGLLVLSWAQAATITINTADLTVQSDSDGLCNLKEAIEAANSNLPSGAVSGECMAGEAHPIIDVIEFDVAMLPAVIPTFETFTITESVHVAGPAKELLTITGIALNRAFHVMNLAADASFTFSDLTFADFDIRLPNDYGGAVWAQHFNGASLTFERVQFLRNFAERGGGAVGLFGGFDNTTTFHHCLFDGNGVNANNTTGAGGGALFIGGNQTVVIENSTFANNTVVNLAGGNPLDDAAGGAILVRANGTAFVSTVTIDQSTFSDNLAHGVGGAVAMGGPGYPNESSEVTIKHSTFVGNEADFNDDQTGDSGGGAIYNGSSNGVNLFNSLVAGNIDRAQNPAPDLDGGYLSFGHNLIGNNSSSATTFPAGQPNINDDFVGEPPVPIVPLVNPLAHYGGPTPTRPPLLNSVAVDQGKCNNKTADQRGHHDDNTSLRAIDQPSVTDFLTTCDIGAVELDATSNNPIPLLNDDAYTLLEGGLLVVPAAQGVLANDSDDGALVVISAGALDSSGSPVQGAVDLWANGAFSFSSDDADAFGTTEFPYTASDQFNAAAATVELTVLPVNDAPFYVASQSHLVVPVGQFLSYPQWATDISPGPANEASQVLVFVVDISSAPSGFFAGLPAIDASTGTLTFELASGATGEAVINVSLRDDGGTDDGGIDTFTTGLTIHASDLIFATDFE